MNRTLLSGATGTVAFVCVTAQTAETLICYSNLLERAP